MLVYNCCVYKRTTQYNFHRPLSNYIFRNISILFCFSNESHILYNTMKIRCILIMLLFCLFIYIFPNLMISEVQLCRTFFQTIHYINMLKQKFYTLLYNIYKINSIRTFSTSAIYASINFMFLKHFK